MRADSIKIETDEDGFHLVIEAALGDFVTPTGTLNIRIDDPEDFYKRVRYEIEPWLREMKEARREYDRMRSAGAVFHNAPDDNQEDAYDLSDPKHPRHHEVFADLADAPVTRRDFYENGQHYSEERVLPLNATKEDA